jgi:hypothetical protein
LTIGLIIVVLLPIAAIGFRALVGDATSRRQLAWPGLVLVVGIAAIAIVELIVGDDGGWLPVLANFILAVGLPFAIAISISKYRPHDIDKLVSRTASYALVIGLLVAFYFGLVALLQVFVPSDNPLVVAASTLAVAALFNPVRKRIQYWVDRRFYRSRYDAERVMDSFASKLRDRVEIGDVVDGWVGVVSETMQPTAVGVWIRDRV